MTRILILFVSQLTLTQTFLPSTEVSLVDEYNIGLLISDQNNQKHLYEKIINHSVAKFNRNSTQFKLRTTVASFDGLSLYGLVSAACKLVSNQTVAVISPEGSSIIASAGDVFGPLNIPLISLAATDPHLIRASRQNILLLSPSDKFQSRAILDLLSYYRWHEIAIIASDSNYGINGVNYLQQLITRRDEVKFVIKAITFFTAETNIDYLQVNNTLHNVKRSLARVIILNCEGQYSQWVLDEAWSMGLLRKDYIWIVTDGTTDNPKNLMTRSRRYVGLIGFRFAITKGTEEFDELRDEFEALLKESGYKEEQLTPTLVMSYDAIQMSGRALNQLQQYDMIHRPDSSCTYELWTAWGNGGYFFEALKSVQYQGAAGSWSFDSDGMVDYASYEIVNFRGDGYDNPKFHQYGSWREAGLLIDPDKQVKFIGGSTKRPVGIANSLNGVQHLRLGVTENPPFASRILKCKTDLCWEGICPDVVKNLSFALNFTYEFIEPLDREFGRLDPDTHTWNGLIGDMLAQRTDMITMDLSVGVERKQYIDFTVSFMDSGISLAMKGESGKSDIFFFLSPFAYTVWLMVLVAFLFIGILINLFSKLSPFGTYGKKVHAMQVCECEGCQDRRLAKTEQKIKFKDHYKSDCLVDRATEDAEDETMNLYNSLWIAGAGLVGQGAEALPTSISGRFILFIWWFFMLLITSMYTANLTAFMTLDKIGITIDSAKELLKEGKKKYEWGILEGSFVESLLINNVDPEFKKLVDGAVKVKTVEEGNQRVHQGGFVFLDETPFLSYNLLGSCNIFQVGNEIQPFDYGFGLPKGSPYTELMNTQIIKFRELGFFDELWIKWDKTPHDGCDHAHEVGADEVLQMSTLQGIFLLLGLGLVISIGLLLVETIVATIQDEYADQDDTFCSKLLRRIRLKYTDIKTEWLMSLKSPPRDRHDSSSKCNGQYTGLRQLDAVDITLSKSDLSHNLGQGV